MSGNLRVRMGVASDQASGSPPALVEMVVVVVVAVVVLVAVVGVLSLIHI